MCLVEVDTSLPTVLSSSVKRGGSRYGLKQHPARRQCRDNICTTATSLDQVARRGRLNVVLDKYEGLREACDVVGVSSSFEVRVADGRVAEKAETTTKGMLVFVLEAGAEVRRCVDDASGDIEKTATEDECSAMEEVLMDVPCTAEMDTWQKMSLS